jgi:hypothetical protein
MKLRRAAAVVAVIALFGIADSRAAFAQEQRDIAFAPPLLADASITADAARPFDIGAALRPVARPAIRPQTRPAPLVGLYASLAGMHALDIVSTQKALAAGAAEANPMMAPFARSPFALAAVKAGVTGATIFATEQLWKTNRKAAVLTMIALNATYGAIAAHNYRVAAAQRGR